MARASATAVDLAKEGEAFGATQFKYLSLNAEQNAGIPYWVFYVLPMMFPEKLPSIGGYSAFDLPWEEGVELPIGMVKRVIGYPRVGINCALCHTARYRLAVDTKPKFVPAGPGNTARIKALSRFFYECAQDPRFNAEICSAKLRTSRSSAGSTSSVPVCDYSGHPRANTQSGPKLSVELPRQPVLGRGQDGARYWRKYLPDGRGPTLTSASQSVSAIWNLAKYQTPNGRGEAQRLTMTGEGGDAATVIADLMAGLLGPRPHDGDKIARDARSLMDYLVRAPPNLSRAAAATRCCPKEFRRAKRCSSVHAPHATGRTAPSWVA